MNRYVTGLDYEYNEFVFHESEKDEYKTAIENANEWVWQFAESKEEALRQHTEKMDAYEQNINDYHEYGVPLPLIDTF